MLRDDQRLCGVISYRIEQRGLTLKQVGEAIGVTADRIAKYLRGVKPSLTNWQIVQLAEYLGVTVELSIVFNRD